MDKPVNSKSDNSTTEAAAAGKPGKHLKRGGLAKVFLTFKHINQASVADAVRQRFSDYVTFGLVIICILSIVAAVVLPVPAGMQLLPLLFTVGAVVFYIINRLGIVLSLTQRQALLVWQILIGSFWLGVTSAMLVFMTCLHFFGNNGR